MLRKVFVFTLLTLSGGQIFAADESFLAGGKWFVVVSGISKHFDTDPTYKAKGLNERNLGLGGQYELHKRDGGAVNFALNFGEYRDSERKIALYAGVAATIDIYKNRYGHIRTGVELAGFHSASYNGSKPFLAPLPLINIGNDSISLNLTVIPRVNNFTDSGVTFAQIKIAY